jgi:hypothetical protein
MTRLARDVPILGVRYIFANERLVTAFDTYPYKLTHPVVC